MIREAAMNALELVPNSVLPIPSAADWTELRSVGRVLSLHPNSLLLAFPCQNLCHIGIKPMGKTPIELTRKLSSRARLYFLEIFDAKGLNIREVHLFQSITNHRLDFIMGMPLPLSELLDFGVKLSPDGLLVREDKAILVVGVHAYDFALLFQHWPRLLHDEVNKKPVVFSAKPDGFGHVPAIDEIFVDDLSGLYGDYHSGCTRTNKFHGVVENSVEGLNFDKVIIQGYNVPAKLGLCPIKLVGGAYSFLSLLSQCLSQPSSDAEPVCAPVDGINICELGREVLPLPEEVGEILSGIVAKAQELYKGLPFAPIELTEIDTG